MWSFKKPTFNLFSIYIVTITNLIRIMQDPSMKIILVIWLILEYHLGVILFNTLIQQWNVNQRMADLGSGMKDMWTNINLGIWLKSSLGSRVSFGSRVGSKSKNWNSYSLSNNGMWLFKIGGACSKYIGTRISVSSGIGPNRIRILEST